MNTSIFKVNDGCDSPRASIRQPYTSGFINEHTDSDSIKLQIDSDDKKTLSIRDERNKSSSVDSSESDASNS